ncbi:MAG: SRPBCC family protein [Gammaproteobacteria bacterium]|nr:SRPBCC family protein [Gammaproteobacteria bacterium]
MTITVEIIINSDVDAVWDAWVTPEDIVMWNAASDDWHTTAAKIDLKPGGEFLFRMEARDGSFGFNFKGVYQNIIDHKLIEYTIEDGRNVSIEFESTENGTKVTETFDAESENSIEAQKKGWQSILNNFARYVESKN